MLAFLQYRIPGNGLILFSAKYDADSGVIVLAFFQVIVNSHIGVHLPYILMCQFSCFEINKDKAFQKVIVEYEVDVEMVTFQVKMLLARYKGKASSLFQQEFLKFIYELCFQFLFVDCNILLHIEKLQNIRVTDKILRLFGRLFGEDFLPHGIFVMT